MQIRLAYIFLLFISSFYWSTELEGQEQVGKKYWVIDSLITYHKLSGEKHLTPKYLEIFAYDQNLNVIQSKHHWWTEKWFCNAVSDYGYDKARLEYSILTSFSEPTFRQAISKSITKYDSLGLVTDYNEFAYLEDGYRLKLQQCIEMNYEDELLQSVRRYYLRTDGLEKTTTIAYYYDDQKRLSYKTTDDHSSASRLKDTTAIYTYKNAEPYPSQIKTVDRDYNIKIDSTGNLVSLEEINPLSDAVEEDYKYIYDEESRLTEIFKSGVTQQLTYDDNGNLILVKEYFRGILTAKDSIEYLEYKDYSFPNVKIPLIELDGYRFRSTLSYKIGESYLETHSPMPPFMRYIPIRITKWKLKSEGLRLVSRKEIKLKEVIIN